MHVRGYGLVKLLVVLAIIFIVAYVVVPPAIELGRIMFSYASLKDEMRGIAKFKAMEEDEDIRKLVVQKAKALGIELLEEDIIVEKYPGERIVIDAY